MQFGNHLYLQLLKFKILTELKAIQHGVFFILYN